MTGLHHMAVDLRRENTKSIAEGGAEVGRTSEAYLIGYLRNRARIRRKQLPGSLQSHLPDQFGGSQTRERLQLPVQMSAT